MTTFNLGRANLWSERLQLDLMSSLVIVLILFLVPLFVHEPYVLGIIIVSTYFALLALGWNLLAGFTGQFSLAPAAFAMLGAYTTAMLDYYWHVPIWMGVSIAFVFTGLVGLVLGKLVLDLKGPYLSLTTLSFAEILRVIISNSHELTRGDQGMNVATFTDNRVIYFYIFAGFLLVVLFGLYLLLRSSFGRFLLAVRDDATGASTRGINVTRTKMISFAISCAICGLAGSLYGTFSQLVSPEIGLMQQTGIVISMVVIGGMGSLTGPIFGAFLVYLSSEWMRTFGNVQMIVFALAVILFARYLRGGLWSLIRNQLTRVFFKIAKHTS